MLLFDRIKGKRKKNGKQESGQCWRFRFGVRYFSADRLTSAMDVAFRCGGASEGITRHLAQHSCVTVTLLWGEAVRATVGGPTEKQHKFQRENQ